MTRFTFILSGGKSRRLAGGDKAVLRLAGKRLIDHAIARLTPQTDRLLISGASDYGAGLEWVPDHQNAPPGPAGGIYSLHHWMLAHEPDEPGFYTSPVDGPFAPTDLIMCLGETSTTSIASDGKHDHPTFAYWRCDTLALAWSALKDRKSISLKALAGACAARKVVWRTADCFFNINTADDLKAAENFQNGNAH